MCYNNILIFLSLINIVTLNLKKHWRMGSFSPVLQCFLFCPQQRFLPEAHLFQIKILGLNGKHRRVKTIRVIYLEIPNAYCHCHISDRVALGEQILNLFTRVYISSYQLSLNHAVWPILSRR